MCIFIINKFICWIMNGNRSYRIMRCFFHTSIIKGSSTTNTPSRSVSVFVIPAFLLEPEEKTVKNDCVEREYRVFPLYWNVFERKSIEHVVERLCIQFVLLHTVIPDNWHLVRLFVDAYISNVRSDECIVCGVRILHVLIDLLEICPTTTAHPWYVCYITSLGRSEWVTIMIERIPKNNKREHLLKHPSFWWRQILGQFFCL